LYNPLLFLFQPFMHSKFNENNILLASTKGFRVTLWIHPFINSECPSFPTASPYLVKNSSGQPGLTSWWQGNVAGYFDFTRSEAGINNHLY